MPLSLRPARSIHAYRHSLKTKVHGLTASCRSNAAEVLGPQLCQTIPGCRPLSRCTELMSTDFSRRCAHGLAAGWQLAPSSGGGLGKEGAAPRVRLLGGGGATLHGIQWRVDAHTALAGRRARRGAGREGRGERRRPRGNGVRLALPPGGPATAAAARQRSSAGH